MRYSDWITTRARANPQMHHQLIVRAMKDVALSSRAKAHRRSKIHLIVTSRTEDLARSRSSIFGPAVSNELELASKVPQSEIDISVEHLLGRPPS